MSTTLLILALIFIVFQRSARRRERAFYRRELGNAPRTIATLREENQELWKITDEQADLLHDKEELKAPEERIGQIEDARPARKDRITCPRCTRVCEYPEDITTYCPNCGTGMGRGKS